MLHCQILLGCVFEQECVDLNESVAPGMYKWVIVDDCISTLYSSGLRACSTWYVDTLVATTNTAAVLPDSD